MSYPYTNQEITEGKPGFNTGRLLYIEFSTVITPRELFKFMDEGFCPVCKATVANATAFVFPTITVISTTTAKTYRIIAAADGTTLATLESKDLDEPFVLVD